MKTVLVMLLLSSSLFLLVILMDLEMNFTLSNILSKEIKPFKVTKATEYTILSFFGVYFAVKSLLGYIKKKQEKQSPQQEQKENSPSGR